MHTISSSLLLRRVFGCLLETPQPLPPHPSCTRHARERRAPRPACTVRHSLLRGRPQPPRCRRPCLALSRLPLRAVARSLILLNRPCSCPPFNSRPPLPSPLEARLLRARGAAREEVDGHSDAAATTARSRRRALLPPLTHHIDRHACTSPQPPTSPPSILHVSHTHPCLPRGEDLNIMWVRTRA